MAVAGEMFTTEAKRRGLAGILIDGGYRDTRHLRAIGLPVYARHITPLAGEVSAIGKTQVRVDCGGIAVEPGDIIFGDDDGVVVLAEHELPDIVRAAEDIQKREEEVMLRMQKGRSLFEHLNFDEHYDKIEKNEPSRLRFMVEG